MTRSGEKKRRARIGLFLQGIGYEYQNEIIAGASAECESRDVDLVCFAGGDLGLGAADHRNAIYSLATQQSIDGLLVAAGAMGRAKGSSEYLLLKQRLGDAPVVGLAAELEEAPSVLVENYACVRQLTEHLIDTHRRRRLAFIGGPGAESQLRLAGYLDALRSRVLRPDPRLYGDGAFIHDTAAAVVEEWFRSGIQLPDAIVAANDWMALGAMLALRRHRVRVPEDVSVIGFDDIDEARFRVPALTTIRQPSWQLGALGVRTVLRALAGETVERVQTLPTVPQIRRSCGCFGEPTSETLHAETLALESSDTGDLTWTWARLLHTNAPHFGTLLPADWSVQLEDALARDLEQGTQVEFPAVLERYVATTAHQGNVTAWHGMVVAMRTVPTNLCPTGDVAQYQDAMARIRERAHMVIGTQAERVQGELRLKREDLLRRLADMSSSVRSAMNHDQLREALLEQLPGLGIGRAFVAWAPGSLTPDTVAELLLAYDFEVGEFPKSRRFHFRAGELVPEQYSTDRRTSMIVIPASFKNSEPLGFFLLEFSDVDGSVYDSLCEQLSVAFKGTLLLRNLVQEATLRGEAERARLEGELRIARKIQSAVLPKNLDVEGLKIATLMVPATEIGGDYFDVLPFAGGAWLTIGDVAGHGLQAGLEMIMLQSIVAALVEGRADADPLEVWQRLNAVLTVNTRSRLATNDHVTLSVLRYLANGRLVGVGAHEDIIVHRARTGRCECVATPGVWAGVMAEPPLSVLQRYPLQLEPGDLLVLYTDGLIEARNERRELFGIERLTREIEAQSALEPNELCHHLYEAAASWAMNRDDDMSLIVARYAGTQSSKAS